MDITQISLYLKDREEKTHEVSLLYPLRERRIKVQKTKPVRFLWLSNLILKLFTFFTPNLSIEAKFKTQLARLLTQDFVRDHLLEDPRRREAFFKALRQSADQIGYQSFAYPPSTLSAKSCAQFLTTVGGASLVDDPKRLSFHVMRMKGEEKTVLDSILTHIERPPLSSGLNIMENGKETSISLMTHYSKFKVLDVDGKGKINYELFQNRTAPATQSTNVINQKVVFDISDEKNPLWLGSYSGNLGSTKKLLEQILLILQVKEAVTISDKPSSLICPILFTSLYCWRELEEVCLQRDAIRALNGKTLEIGDERVTLRLFYYNLTIHRVPIPAETKAFFEDLNDECIIRLFEQSPFSTELENLPNDFFERQKRSLDTIDRFRSEKTRIIKSIHEPVFKALLEKRSMDGRSIKGMDVLLYLEEATKQLGIFHNKNCQNGLDRTSTAKAADKAQNAVRKVTGSSYLPGYNESKQLFRALYSLYLLWEEADINAALTNGISRGPFFKRLFYLNPQQSEYLAEWMHL